ncbi:MAG: PIG-L family deacetylase [Anaerolineales bacterium]|nr:PIG-L family deacetylase [Anaerolineales bacterium]
MHWIYLSPHLDDVVLSCGGLVWEQTRLDQPVDIWTICAGDPPEGPLSPFAQELHARWQTPRDAAQQRRQEDIASCGVLSAGYFHFSIPDCIYRRSHRETSRLRDLAGAGHADTEELFLYASEQALFSPVHPSEKRLVRKLTKDLVRTLPTGAEVVCPLALGGHVDHRLTRQVVEGLSQSGAKLISPWYYADYPYVLRMPEYAENLLREGWQAVLHPISPAGLDAWGQGVAAHQSQISSFWPSVESMHAALREYWVAQGGIYLWKAPLDAG